MRILSTLLKPAALLLVGASAVFGGAANALTFDWNIVTNNPSYPGGSGTFTTGAPTVNIYTITGVTGTWDGISITGISNGTNDYAITSPDNTFSYSADGDLNVTTGGISFLTSDGNAHNIAYYGLDLYGAADTAIYYDPSSGVATGANGISTSTIAQAVPGPLPILGIPAVLFYTRKLKKRINVRMETSEASLT